MTIKPSIKTERERAQEVIDDSIEAISVLDSAIKCDFLKHSHNLIAQKWIKEYEDHMDEIEYKEKRKLEYGTWEEQLDMMHHGTWEAHVQAVRDKYPK